MDTQRLVLFVVFSFSLLMLWEAWQKAQNPPAPTTVSGQQSDVPSGAAAKSAVPGAQTGAAVPGAAGKAATATPAQPPAPAAPRQRIRVETDLVVADIDTQG